MHECMMSPCLSWHCAASLTPTASIGCGSLCKLLPVGGRLSHEALATIDGVQVPMWVNGQDQGQWAFMAFCSKPGFITDAACNQPITYKTQVNFLAHFWICLAGRLSWIFSPCTAGNNALALMLQPSISKVSIIVSRSCLWIQTQ